MNSINSTIHCPVCNCSFSPSPERKRFQLCTNCNFTFEIQSDILPFNLEPKIIKMSNENFCNSNIYINIIKNKQQIGDYAFWNVYKDNYTIIGYSLEHKSIEYVGDDFLVHLFLIGKEKCLFDNRKLLDRHLLIKSSEIINICTLENQAYSIYGENIEVTPSGIKYNTKDLFISNSYAKKYILDNRNLFRGF